MNGNFNSVATGTTSYTLWKQLRERQPIGVMPTNVLHVVYNGKLYNQLHSVYYSFSLAFSSLKCSEGCENHKY